MTEIKIKPLSEQFILPTKASHGSAAYDAFVPRHTKLKWGRQVIPLGFAVEMPHSMALDCRSRSGYSLKGLLVWDRWGYQHRINADVTLGLIDSDYRGEVGAIVDVKDWRIFFMDFWIGFGQAVGQLKFCVVPDTRLIVTHDDLSPTDRGNNGFGRQNNE